MFKNKGIKNYIKASENIILPNVEGVKDNKRKNNKKKFTVMAVACAAILVLSIGTDKFTNIIDKNSGKYVVKACEVDGSKVKLKENNKILVGNSNDESISFDGFEIEGENIESIDMNCKNGILIYSTENDLSSSSVMVGEDSFGESVMVEDDYPISTENNYVITSDEDIKDVEQFITIDEIENEGDRAVSISNFNNENNNNKVSWIPGDNVEGINNEIVNIKILFKDGTVEEKQVQFTLNDNGDIYAKLM